MFGCLWGRDSIVYSSVCLHVSRHCVCSSCRSVSSSESSWQTHHWTPGAVPGSRRGKLIFIVLINWTSQDFLFFFVLLTLLYESYVFENGKKGTIGRSVLFPTDHKQNKKPEELLHCLFREWSFMFSLCKFFCVFILFIHSFIYYLVGCPWNCQSDCDGHDGDGNDPSWGQEENLDVW